MIIQFKSTSGEVVNTNFVTPQLMATVGPFSKLITYPTYAKSGDYSYSGPYYGEVSPPGTDPNYNPGQLGNTEPVEGQLTADYDTGEGLVKVGPTGSYLFPLGQGGSYIGFYSPTGVLYTKFKMEDAAAAATGITTIATALGAGDAYLLLDVDGSNITPP
jgi:hypothetical protein